MAEFFGVGREVLVAKTVGERQAGQHAPIVLCIGINHVGAKVAFVYRGVKGGFLGQSKQEIGKRRTGVLISGCVFSEQAAEREASGRIRTGEKVVVDAP